MIVSGGCHCGAVRFACDVPATVEVLDCNCSICAKTGFLHLIVDHANFTLESGRDALISYRFGTCLAEHLFCRICGIKGYYQPRSHPGAWSVNLRCLDLGHGLDVVTRPFDGRNWKSAHTELG